ncbi:DUF6602 domain-containing protein [Paraburkholderia sp. XV]|uniref:DUF6602 domain-containing protein n=1 Tax=Paraburkholderia sp. XV TaxID=2831520 RepID=UPI001CD530CD|nr:DUF6602 domain-containing protein [Paraburkholderia sp. XV]
MAYKNFVENVSKQVDSLFANISARYNFDLGDEFELAVCEVLRMILPEKYGICRGFVVTQDGTCAGDDIIIFDSQRIPTLRFLTRDQWDRKEEIPVEAVYAYIEAKHTLCLGGNGGQSVAKAAKQIAAVKALPRAAVPLNEIVPGILFPGNATRNPGYPDVKNPMLALIVSRQVRLTDGDAPTTVDSFFQRLQQVSSDVGGIQQMYAPDLVIAGTDAVCFPTVSGHVESPFSRHGVTSLSPCNANGLGWGVGLAALMWALDEIQLGRIAWSHVAAAALNLPTR